LVNAGDIGKCKLEIGNVKSKLLLSPGGSANLILGGWAGASKGVNHIIII